MTETLWELAIAALAFVGAHVVFSGTPLRAVLVGRLGVRMIQGLFELLIAAMLWWMIAAYGAAPFVEVWEFAPWMRWVPILVVPVSCVLLVSGASTSNPTLPGMEKAAAKGPLGIIKVTRHPMMWGIGLWALAHMVANGDAASLIFFAALALLALGGTVLIDRKKRIALGADWEPLARASSNLPFAAVLAGRCRVSLGEIGYWRIALGLALYAAVLFAHEYLFGVPALP